MKYLLILFSAFFCGLSMADSVQASEATPPLSTPLVGWQTWTSSGERILPSTEPPKEATNATIRLVSARGTIATATFAVRSSSDLKSVALRPSALKTKNGLVLSSDAFDLRVVKCWYQDANAWFTPKRASGNSVLVPELLLHDDTLIRIDPKTRENLIRTSPAGVSPTYRRIKAVKGGVTVPAQKDFVAADDAKTLLPLPIAKDETRQFHLAIKVDSKTRPGLYHGKIELAADGRQLGHFNVSLRVLDHLLPATVSRFSIHGGLDGNKVPTGDAPAVLSTETTPFQSIVALPPAHLTPTTVSFLLDGGFTSPVIQPSDLAKCKALFGPRTPSSLWIAFPLMLEAPARSAPSPAKALKLVEEAKRTGVKELHVFLPSRLSGKGLAEDAKTFEVVDDADVSVWTYATDKTYAEAAALIRSPMGRGLPPTTSAWRYNDKIHERDYDTGHFDCYEYTDTRPAERWHKIGVPYYHCSTAPAAIEDPSVWRRRFGAECYYLGYDGFIIPSVMEAIDPWNDWTSDDHRSRTFLYPTKTSFIETLAWDGIREGLVDARYLSSMRLLAQKIRMKGLEDPLFDLEGRRAAMWLDALHVQRCDLDTMRLDAIAWIDKLQRCLELEVHKSPYQ